MTERMTAEEFRAIREADLIERPSKYRNKKTTVDGVKFDSKREAEFYSSLKQLERAGQVYEVELQKPYALTVNGQLVCTYKADFAFYDAIQKRNRVVDIKGVATKDFVIKKKLMRAVFGIDVEVVR
ncbi:DUF1064 domain-containing protein [Sinorhizobium medicae]|uniref:DUF1064 domain-containing protein n=1 Tax=Sinorhizobium medicae TaxID=110321 RepID=UPI0012950109|nr:DUF1064 domain-containing protein [Sinorhizobium medicae]MDX0530767.1 DUF1064 domain-containing protein [Sinorhizobium medicae]MDX0905244.1 DUF1064 domain-containing protein [Sinorhizobium medicae]MDX1163306.1 DUF1064 domain-containing protein [Sinorhizobium medicae]MQV48307.1 DUF1064 domain-containing protein [Sinorhizobium medicae]MQV53919.1 DUF1064 domain-containing protein [Sinorhizobium medicae]